MASIEFGNEGLSDQDLVAYADGELDDATMASVEQRLADNEQDRIRLRRLVAAGALAQAAFADGVEDAASAPVAARVPPQPQPAPAPVEPTRIGRVTQFWRPHRPARPANQDVPLRNRLPGWTQTALAASIAVVCVTGAVGLGLFADPMGQRGSGLALHADVRSALSDVPSYAPQETQIGNLMVYGTFRATDGRLCREFEVVGTDAAHAGLACRAADAPWSLIASQDLTGSAGGGADVYRAASGDTAGAGAGAVAEAVEQLQSGPVLDPEAERAALLLP